MSSIIQLANAALPRSLDVSVTVSKPQSEQTTDYSTPVFVQSSGGFDFGASRLAFYATYAAVAADARVSAAGLLAARDFFAQPKRPAFMAIAQAFTTPQRGYVKSGAVTALPAAFQAVTAGSFSATIDAVTANVTGLNLSTGSSYATIATLLQTAIRAANAAAGWANAIVTWNATTSQFTISSGTTGNGSLVSVLAPSSPAVGTDISGPGFLNARAGTAVTQIGYTPTGITQELDLINEAATASGRFVYGWAFDATYRDTADQILAAQWVASHTAVTALVSNSPLAWDPSSTTDLGPQLKTLGIYRAWPIYHDKPAYYPDMAVLAVMLSVDYAAFNSTITGKFKDLVGIPLVGITESQWLTLDGKAYNTFTLTGNTSRVYRDGATASPSWFADDVVNLDNFKEDMSVRVYNVFLRNGKVPYTVAGQMLLQDAITESCERYVYNGTLAERRVTDLTEKVGYRTDPAYTIVATPIQQMSASDRAQRIGPPFVVNVNLAGAIHSIAISVNAY